MCKLLFSSSQPQCFSLCFPILPLTLSNRVWLHITPVPAATQSTLWVSVWEQQRLGIIYSLCNFCRCAKVTIAEIGFAISHHCLETISNLYEKWKISLWHFQRRNLVSHSLYSTTLWCLEPPFRNIHWWRLMIIMVHWDKRIQPMAQLVDEACPTPEKNLKNLIQAYYLASWVTDNLLWHSGEKLIGS